MKLRIVPASSGLKWMRQGLQALRRQPMNYMGLVGMLIGAAVLLAVVPIIGPLVVVGVMPTVWLGFILATRRVVLGERITPGVMTEAVRAPDNPRKAFAQLAGIYIAAVQMMMLLASWLGPGAEVIAEAMEAMQDSTELVVSPVVVEDMLWRMGLLLPISLVFWHAPALVLWAKLPVGKALFFSAVATWRNLGAFLVYGLSWLGALVALGLFDRLLLSAIPVPVLANALAFAGALALAGAFYASLYFTTVDCFESPEASPADGMPRLP